MGKKALRYFTRILMKSLLLSVFMMPFACAPQPMAQRYSARGMIVSVEEGTGGGSRVSILHEAIPDFKNQAGQKVGMEPMVMTFAADQTIRTEGFQPRAKIQFLFEVHWQGSDRLILKEIQSLDDQTPLEFKGYSVEMA